MATTERETVREAIRHFDAWPDAFEWAHTAAAVTGERYMVRSLRNGKWEAIKAWLWFM